MCMRYFLSAQIQYATKSYLLHVKPCLWTEKKLVCRCWVLYASKYISCVRFLVLLRVTLTPPFPRIVIFSLNQVLLLPFWLQFRSNLQNNSTKMCAKSSKNMSKLSCNNINFCGECLWVWYWNMEVCCSSVSLHFISTPYHNEWLKNNQIYFPIYFPIHISRFIS